MRSVQLATTLLLAGFVGAMTFACNSDDGGTPSPNRTGSGGTGTATGGPNGTGGTMTGPTPGTGGGPSTPANGCTNTVVSTGVPSMIDDFDTPRAGWNFPDDSDGRVGTWEHEWAINMVDGREDPADPECGDPSGCLEAGMGGAGELTPGHLIVRCDGEAHCAGGAFTTEDPWGNWAALSTPLAQWSETDVNCYDASQFTGVQFKAWSSLGTKIRIQMVDPDADVTQGYTYQSTVITLPTERPTEPTQVPFSSLVIPMWVTEGGLGGQMINPAALRSLTFAVRSTSPESGDTGERIAPYEINLDDVEFY